MKEGVHTTRCESRTSRLAVVGRWGQYQMGRSCPPFPAPTCDRVCEPWDGELASWLAQGRLEVRGEEAGVSGGAHQNDSEPRVAACGTARRGRQTRLGWQGTTGLQGSMGVRLASRFIGGGGGAGRAGDCTGAGCVRSRERRRERHREKARKGGQRGAGGGRRAAGAPTRLQQRAQQEQQQVRLDAALVHLVQDHVGGTAQLRITQQAAQQDACSARARGRRPSRLIQRAAASLPRLPVLIHERLTSPCRRGDLAAPVSPPHTHTSTSKPGEAHLLRKPPFAIPEDPPPPFHLSTTAPPWPSLNPPPPPPPTRGAEEQAGAGRLLGVQPDGVAHAAAHGLAALRRHARGQAHGGDAARLGAQDGGGGAAPRRYRILQQELGHLRRRWGGTGVGGGWGVGGRVAWRKRKIKQLCEHTCNRHVRYMAVLILQGTDWKQAVAARQPL
jgi:hypothetical protein